MLLRSTHIRCSSFWRNSPLLFGLRYCSNLFSNVVLQLFNGDWIGFVIQILHLKYAYNKKSQAIRPGDRTDHATFRKREMRCSRNKSRMASPDRWAMPMRAVAPFCWNHTESITIPKCYNRGTKKFWIMPTYRSAFTVTVAQRIHSKFQYTKTCNTKVTVLVHCVKVDDEFPWDSLLAISNDNCDSQHYLCTQNELHQTSPIAALFLHVGLIAKWQAIKECNEFLKDESYSIKLFYYWHLAKRYCMDLRKRVFNM